MGILVSIGGSDSARQPQGCQTQFERQLGMCFQQPNLSALSDQNLQWRPNDSVAVPAGVAGPPVIPPAVANAQFHALHLVTVMTELLPEWLPQQLFDILYARWRSPARMQRCAAGGTSCIGHFHRLVQHIDATLRMQ